ncbi:MULTISPECIES: DUF397 domain-containing protein [Micromonospora]|jgi:hypothetical protein|uniref:DUF397 domain-containing protein n=1 Tax=Micromonospora sicca TaxID=2202420 RepID=A0A317DMV8_9ACTN|nr:MULTISPECIES: DUF397 domain-containing protein [unclassified Micromonospora]MBM0229019.1 DUF397 domain-containing protein [Micromonospora sp. ATA51]MDZ5442489.1 DUF397 domain-containing protein [Micromonospora sp. 4G57]MDZ5491721.1 DUF397 domain-containing protein [Micromonospora sp. 4G53]PWR16119.1 DUF397 domain-containing protein [Micromonospora sp. 4G51]
MRSTNSLHWRKSSHSGDEGACVEMAVLPAAVAVRDSKDPTGPTLVFSPAAWAAFTGAPPRD